jgi:hypothetical protein
VAQLVSNSIFWCCPGVQSSLGLLKQYFGDKKSVPFTTVHKHYNSPISPFKSMWSKNVSMLLIYNHTLPLSHYNGVCHLFRSVQNFYLLSCSSSTSSCSYSDIAMYTCTNKTFTGFTFNFKSMMLLLHTIFVKTFFILLLFTIIAAYVLTLSPLE